MAILQSIQPIYMQARSVCLCVTDARTRASLNAITGVHTQWPELSAFVWQERKIQCKYRIFFIGNMKKKPILPRYIWMNHNQAILTYQAKSLWVMRPSWACSREWFFFDWLVAFLLPLMNFSINAWKLKRCKYQSWNKF